MVEGGPITRELVNLMKNRFEFMCRVHAQLSCPAVQRMAVVLVEAVGWLFGLFVCCLFVCCSRSVAWHVRYVYVVKYATGIHTMPSRR